MKFLKQLINYLKNHKKIIIAAVVVLAVIAFFLRPKAPPAIPTQTIGRGDIQETVSATGTVVAKNSVDLNFQVPGLVTYVGVKKGDKVSAYQTIATTDERTTLKNLQIALLSYSDQRNTFDQTYANNGNAKTPDDAVNDTIKRILQDNQYDLDKSVDSVELQNLAVQQSVLTTPIAGIVTRTDITTAGVVASPTTTFTVIDPGSVAFDMDVDEADIANVTVGKNVSVNLDAYPNTNLNLKVTSIDFVSHTTSTGGTAFTVEAILPSNNNYAYRVGMNGNGDILIQEKDNIVIVPLVAIFNDNHVYVKTKSGYQDRTIELGLEDDTDGQVISGLKAGDVVALQPSLVPKSLVTK